MKSSHLLLATCVLLLSASSAQAQRTKSTDGEPCCSIAVIDLQKALITARDNARKTTFQFEVKDAALLKSLRVGQAVFADFATGKVRIHGSEPCCSITSPTVKPDVNPAEPCCAITALNAATGIVTAKEIATGRMFRFEVKDMKLLGSLKVGQKVFADFGSSKVRIHGVEPCCGIIGHGMN
jgi:Cu/Ag efflux protein CusF